jgi:hypothetical protein
MKEEIKIALQNIESVVAAYRGTLQEHSQLQKDLKLIKEALTSPAT